MSAAQGVSQNINLLADQENKDAWSGRRMLLLPVVLLLSLALAGAFLQWQHHKLQVERRALEKERLQWTTELAQLKARVAAQEDPVMQKQLQSARQKLADSVRMEQRLVPVAGPYSRLLSALAGASHPGVWLTDISAEEAGVALALSGQAHSSAALADYLAGLGRQPVLAGREFAEVNVSDAVTGTSLSGTAIVFHLENVSADAAHGGQGVP